MSIKSRILDRGLSTKAKIIIPEVNDDRVKKAIKRLNSIGYNIVNIADYKNNTFSCKDLKNKKKIRIPSITNYFLLYADLNNELINKKIIKSLKNYNKSEKYIFSSIKPNHQSFEEKRYWRGPVWINCNWIIYQG